MKDPVHIGPALQIQSAMRIPHTHTCVPMAEEVHTH